MSNVQYKMTVPFNVDRHTNLTETAKIGLYTIMSLRPVTVDKFYTSRWGTFSTLLERFLPDALLTLAVTHLAFMIIFITAILRANVDGFACDISYLSSRC